LDPRRLKTARVDRQRVEAFRSCASVGVGEAKAQDGHKPEVGMSPRIFGRKTLYSPDLPDSPYLFRWTLFSCGRFQILLHRFLRSDSAAVHDHPWSFVSIVLWGGYREELQRADLRIETRTTDALRMSQIVEFLHRPWFSLARRRAEDRHRVEIDGPAWTLVVTGPRRRDWYFYPRGVRVPWRVMVAFGEATVERLLDTGKGADFFDAQDRYIRSQGGVA
jgi:hypothetical protein